MFQASNGFRSRGQRGQLPAHAPSPPTDLSSASSAKSRRKSTRLHQDLAILSCCHAPVTQSTGGEVGRTRTKNCNSVPLQAGFHDLNSGICIPPLPRPQNDGFDLFRGINFTLFGNPISATPPAPPLAVHLLSIWDAFKIRVQNADSILSTGRKWTRSRCFWFDKTGNGREPFPGQSWPRQYSCLVWVKFNAGLNGHAIAPTHPQVMER